jgi:hypothetical protein
MFERSGGMLIADSAYPQASYPASWNGQPIVGWGFYIGGNTPHRWSAAEVAVLKAHYRYLLPIYTCSNPGSRNAAADAAAATEEDEMAQAQNGYATFSWSQGERHVVQVAFDTIGGNQPVLRAVLLLTSGPLVLAEAWKPDHTEAGKVVRFTEHQADAYGLELQPVGTPARYAANVS